MAEPITLALDAMGGDAAPGMVIAGAALALKRAPELRFLIVGDEARISPLLAKRKALAAVTEIRHTPDIVAGDEKPAVALRSGRSSSMRLAIDAVAEGEAAAVVSAGNTGALMAMAKFVFKTLPGIDRPAITSFFPTRRGETAMLDLGANAICTAENLQQFAIMGALFARIVLGVERPSVGLLNIGSEETKGNDVVQAAAALLRKTALPGEFAGFVEGDGVPGGAVDVVVTDGFTGNVALKIAEGTSSMIIDGLRKSIRASMLARLGAVLMAGVFRSFRERMDPRRYNGAMFLGLRSICVKSHGGTDAFGFANAIDVAADLVRDGFNEKLQAELAGLVAASPVDETAGEMAGVGA